MKKDAVILLEAKRSLSKLKLTKKAKNLLTAISNDIKSNPGKQGLRNTQSLSTISPLLFYGTQTAEQALAAASLAQINNQVAYRVDLSQLVSKYIGETEKNIDSLFNTAEKKDWILLFDEADALFGKRTGVKDAHDKYANQEVSYLLQKIETSNRLVILASNKKSNLDAAFTKRLRYIINFQKPRKTN